MKLPPDRRMPLRLVTALLGLGLISLLLGSCSRERPPAESLEGAPPKPADATNAAARLEPAVTNAPPTGAQAESATTNAPPGAGSTSPAPPPAPGSEIQAKTGEDKPADSDQVQLSFQGANIDMVVQWLAKTTGKSVAKHPRVQCQLTIVSSSKLSTREAIDLVYRALALEGFTTIESGKAIFIVPEGQEPKLSPELLDNSQTEVPEGRQRLIRVFPLQHVRAAELRDRIKVVLSEKASVALDDRSNQLIVTDYNENIRLLGELIKELDVASATDIVIELYPLKYGQAEELASLLGQILNAKAASPPSSSARPQPPSDSPMPPGAPPQPAGGDAQAPTDQVRFWADKTANRLIVAAPKSKWPEIRDLIELLDKEKPEDVAIRVIPLKHVSAEDLVKDIAPLYQKLSGKSVKDLVEVSANTRANAVIVLSSELNFKAIEKLIAALDTEEAQEKVMRAFPLKNADAEDVARQLQELNQDQPATSRYVYYFSPSSSRPSAKMSVVADRRRNTVVVQAPPAAMESIAKMIATLDEPVSDDSLAPRIFPLKYVSAVDIEDVLNELFTKRQERRSYWDYYYDDYGTSSRDQDAGRLYGKVRITSEPYSNSIIVTSNSPENLMAVEEVLKQLDVPSQAGETTVRANLQFAQSVTVATSLNILFAKGGAPPLRQNQPQGTPGDNRGQQPQPSTSQSNFELEKETEEDAYYPWLGGQPDDYRSLDGRSATRPVSDLVGRVRVVPDKRGNSLMITSNVHLLPQVLKLINELDAPTPQVLIEAKIVEVSSDFRDKLGVRWAPDGSQAFDAEDRDNAILVESTGEYRKVFAGSLLADSLHTGLLDSKLNLDFLIQFLRKTVGAKVLAEPQINIADNEMGKLFVGSQVPFISGSLNTDVGGRNDTFQYRDVGIILEVTPHINSAQDVALRIRAESSNIRNGQTLFGGAILDTRNFRTEVVVKSGETLVLGGIIQREESETVRKVPLLGSIPVLGLPFRKKDKVSREVELMVFLRPRVTRTPEQAKQLLEDIEKQIPRIQRWKEDLRLKEPGPPIEKPQT